MDAATRTIFRYLGPWAGGSVPADVRRETVSIDDGLEGWMYEPTSRPVHGAWVLVAGLHFLGPKDPRFDRFARILAASGTRVLSPFLRDPLQLLVRERTAEDLATAFDWFEARNAGLPKPAVFSISFGSLAGLKLATRPSHADRIGALVLFGGYADFRASIRYAIRGEAEHGGVTIRGRQDPLNPPALFVNLASYLELPEPELLTAAWREMCRRTWGRMDLKAPGALLPHAEAVALTLPPHLRETFLLGCSLRPGAADAIDEGLRRAGTDFDFADVRPHFPNLRAPVAIVHGRDDDVIPWTEARRLQEALPEGHPHAVRITGFYGHTGAELPSPASVVRELQTMRDVVGILAAAPRGEKLSRAWTHPRSGL